MNDTNIGALLLVEDEKADQYLIKKAFDKLKIGNEIVVAEEGAEALEYLRSGKIQPILILCDINMPKMNGLELREAIYNDQKLRRQCIPFIFMSTNASQETVEKAFDYAVQGYFEKAKDFNDALALIETIISYWKRCKNPNHVEFKTLAK
ncbi:MAG: response regulator [Bacteroidetes bacterium]|nr:response regulator [Bacteroidota bacterium]